MSLLTSLSKKMGGIIIGEKIIGRRNNFFVEKEFQKSFILFFLAIVSIMIILSGGAFYYVIHNAIELNMYTVHQKIVSIKDVLTPNLIIFFVQVTVIALVVIVLIVDRVLSRIAKSLMVYERIADRLTKLDFKRAKSIEVDQFTNLHRQYRELIEKYSADVTQLREKVGRMEVLASYLEDCNGAPKADKITAISELIELKGAMESKLMEYKLDDMINRT